ncbi:MAG TPA: TRAP transporter small permease [Candidatus Methylomirabilis sp.]|nr:TRAP transporter small permease [Candidatus Methylomirabilis sp.]
MALSRFEQTLVTANRAIVFLMMAVMATLVFTNVITRYLFNFSIIWAEEVSQYLMVWIAFLGAGLALRQGRHVAVEMFQERLRPPLGRALRAAIAGMILVFLAVLTVLGFQFVAFAWIQETPVLNISLGIPYLAVPIGALLFVLHLCFVFRSYVQRQFEPVHVLDELAETQG